MSDEESNVVVIKDVDEKSELEILYEIIEKNREGLQRLAEEKPTEELRVSEELQGLRGDEVIDKVSEKNRL